MPNWCSNKIIIDLSESRDCDFARKIVLLKMGIPITQEEMPHGFFGYLCNSEDRERTAADNCGDWGTKWDVAEPRLTTEDDDGSPDVMFTDSEGRYVWLIDTAWSPPAGFIEKLSEINPTAVIALLYVEQGADCIGFLTIENGKVKENQQESLIGLTDKTYWNYLAHDWHVPLEELSHQYFIDRGFDPSGMSLGG